jgi:hypothetical protein
MDMHLEESRCKDPSSDVVILLLGFWGAQPRILRKYATFFNSQGHDVMFGIAPYVGVLLKSRMLLEPFAKAAAERTRSLADGRHVAVVSMSNGGCFPLQQLFRLRAMGHGEQSCAAWAASCIVLRFAAGNVAARLRLLLRTCFFDVAESVRGINWAGLMFDSSPAAFDVAKIATAAALAGGGGIMGTLLYGFAYCMLSVAWLLDSSGCCISFEDSIAGFTEAMATGPTDGPELFVYSKTDKLVDYAYVEEVAVRRTELRGAAVSKLCFEDSPHVGHLREHPEAYTARVAEWLEAVEASIS